MLSVRGEFGYWVFEGDWQPAQRPSWNYRREDGGGIILDMLCHWRYVLDNLFGEVKAVCCLGATHIPERVDEAGQALHGRRGRCGLCDLRARGRGDRADQLVLDDAGAARRPRDLPGRRDARVGGGGAAKCWTQHRVNTPKPVWNPDLPQTIDFFETWDEVPDNEAYDNGFKAQWEMFLRHVVEDAPWRVRAGRGREGRAARGARAAELEGAALARRAGAGGLTMATVNLPTADRRIERLRRPATPLAFERPERRRSTASPMRRRTWSPTRWRTSIPWLTPAIDWEATLRFRHQLWDLGLGVAEAMDTAQRGMGLGWPEAKELIGRALAAARGAAGGADRLRRRHRPSGAGAGGDDRRRHPRLRGADRGGRGAGRADHPDGEPGAGRGGDRGRTTMCGSMTGCSARCGSR